MSGPDGYFDELVAATYDESEAAQFDPAVVDATVGFLAGIAGTGRALEFGIGTGRIALPLAHRGVDVCGIDLSAAMVARLREKPGGGAVDTAIGDFAMTRVEGSFALVYLVFNTIENLTTQAEQVACFRNAAAHLEPGGCFVVEVGVPQLRRLPPGDRAHVFHMGGTHWGIDEYDVAAQGLTSHHLTVRDGAVVATHSIPFRYVWPAELDLMAELAGMRLRERWGGWNREPFTAESDRHVSVWEKVSGASAADEAAFHAAAAAFVDVVGRVPRDAWDRPALGVWNVRDLVGHASRALATIESYLGREVEGERLAGPLAYFGSARTGLADPEAVARRGREAGTALGGDPAHAVAELALRVKALVRDAAPGAVVGTPAGPMTLADYLPTRTFELTVHTLDLARAVDLTVPDALGPAVEACCALAGRMAAEHPDAAELLLLLTGRTGLRPGLTVL